MDFLSLFKDPYFSPELAVRSETLLTDLSLQGDFLASGGIPVFFIGSFLSLADLVVRWTSFVLAARSCSTSFFVVFDNSFLFARSFSRCFSSKIFAVPVALKVVGGHMVNIWSTSFLVKSFCGFTLLTSEGFVVISTCPFGNLPGSLSFCLSAIDRFFVSLDATQTARSFVRLRDCLFLKFQ